MEPTLIVELVTQVLGFLGNVVPAIISIFG